MTSKGILRTIVASSLSFAMVAGFVPFILDRAGLSTPVLADTTTVPTEGTWQGTKEDKDFEYTGTLTLTGDLTIDLYGDHLTLGTINTNGHALTITSTDAQNNGNYGSFECSVLNVNEAGSNVWINVPEFGTDVAPVKINEIHMSEGYGYGNYLDIASIVSVNDSIVVSGDSELKVFSSYPHQTASPTSGKLYLNDGATITIKDNSGESLRPCIINDGMMSRSSSEALDISISGSGELQNNGTMGKSNITLSGNSKLFIMDGSTNAAGNKITAVDDSTIDIRCDLNADVTIKDRSDLVVSNSKRLTGDLRIENKTTDTTIDFPITGNIDIISPDNTPTVTINSTINTPDEDGHVSVNKDTSLVVGTNGVINGNLVAALPADDSVTGVELEVYGKVNHHTGGLTKIVYGRVTLHPGCYFDSLYLKNSQVLNPVEGGVGPELNNVEIDDLWIESVDVNITESQINKIEMMESANVNKYMSVNIVDSTIGMVTSNGIKELTITGSKINGVINTTDNIMESLYLENTDKVKLIDTHTKNISTIKNCAEVEIISSNIEDLYSTDCTTVTIDSDGQYEEKSYIVKMTATATKSNVINLNECTIGTGGLTTDSPLIHVVTNPGFVANGLLNIKGAGDKPEYTINYIDTSNFYPEYYVNANLLMNGGEVNAGIKAEDYSSVAIIGKCDILQGMQALSGSQIIVWPQSEDAEIRITGTVVIEKQDYARGGKYYSELTVRNNSYRDDSNYPDPIFYNNELNGNNIVARKGAYISISAGNFNSQSGHCVYAESQDPKYIEIGGGYFKAVKDQVFSGTPDCNSDNATTSDRLNGNTLTVGGGCFNKEIEPRFIPEWYIQVQSGDAYEIVRYDPALDSDTTHVSAKSATCSESGNKEYYHSTIYGYLLPYTTENNYSRISLGDLTIPAKGHDYGEPYINFTWHNIGEWTPTTMPVIETSECFVRCNTCGHNHILEPEITYSDAGQGVGQWDATVTYSKWEDDTHMNENVIPHTATITDHPITYTKTEYHRVAPAIYVNAELDITNVVQVNVYYVFGNTLNEERDFYALMTDTRYGAGTGHNNKSQRIDLNTLSSHRIFDERMIGDSPYGERYYMMSFVTSAKDMTDPIRCSVMDLEASTAPLCTYDVTVKDYLTYLANSDSEQIPADIKAICASCLDYGAAAQIHFGIDTDNLANADLNNKDAYKNPDVDLPNFEVFDRDALNDALNVIHGTDSHIYDYYGMTATLTSSPYVSLVFKIREDMAPKTVLKQIQKDMVFYSNEGYQDQSVPVYEIRGNYVFIHFKDVAYDIWDVANENSDKNLRMYIPAANTNINFGIANYFAAFETYHLPWPSADQAKVRDVINSLLYYSKLYSAVHVSG